MQCTALTGKKMQYRYVVYWKNSINIPTSRHIGHFLPQLSHCAMQLFSMNDDAFEITRA